MTSQRTAIITGAEPGVLTRDDLTALRLADAVTFHHHTSAEAGPRISLHLETRMTDEPRIFTATQQRVFPSADGRGRQRDIHLESTASGYASDGLPGWNSSDAGHLSCFYMIHTAQFSQSWLTIARLLKVGDRLALQWLADNNTQTLTDAGLHNDQLHLHVHRAGDRLVFPIATSVCPDNSARMIRRHAHV
jgi:hypothetical protein